MSSVKGSRHSINDHPTYLKLVQDAYVQANRKARLNIAIRNVLAEKGFSKEETDAFINAAYEANLDPLIEALLK